MDNRAVVKSLTTYILLVVLLIALIPQSARSEEEPIRIGVTFSMEGRYKSLSFMVKNGYELWAEEVNRRGGILGRSVEIVSYNDKSSKKLVGTLYERLITKDRVDLVLSPYGSSLTMRAAEVTEQHGYVLLASSASSLEIWDRGFNRVFGVYSTAERYFLGFLDLLARQGYRRIGVVYSDATFNVSAAEGVKKWANLFGLSIVSYEKFEDGKADFQKIAETQKDKNIEGLIFCGYPPDGYAFLQSLEKNSIRPPGLAATILPALPDFYENLGSYAENIFGPSQWEPDKRLPFPGTLEFIDNFTHRTGRAPSYQACSSYSAGQILERAVEQAGSIDHEKIRNYVSSLDTVTIMGRFKVDFHGKQIGHNPILVQWQNGKKEIVYPTKMRTSAARFSTNHN